MDRRTTLVYYRNGSLEVVDEHHSPLASGVIVVLCLLLGLCYNLLVIGPILTSDKLRRSPFHIALSMLAIVSLLDLVTNETFAFGFLFDLATSLCTTSATTFHLFLLTHTAALSLLFLQRVLELKERVVSVRMALCGVLITWTFGIVPSVTLLVSSDTHYFPYRNACCALKTNVWSSAVYFLSVLACWTGTAATCFLSIKSSRPHLGDQRITVLSVLPTITDANIPNRLRPSHNANQNKLAFTILFIYVILLLPHTLSVVVHLFLTPIFKADPWIGTRVKGQVRSVTTNDLEPLFVYSRYVYNAVLPISILLNDIQTRLQSRMVFCCRWNEVTNLGSSERIMSSTLHDESQIPDTTYDLRTPILFPTREGLHLRIPQSGVSTNISESSTSTRDNLKVVTTFCDLKTDHTLQNEAKSNIRTTSRVVEAKDTVPDKSAEIESNIRPSSKVGEIILDSGVWGSNLSETQTVNIPLFVKGEQVPKVEHRESLNSL